jgi:hypothetical protein
MTQAHKTPRPSQSQWLQPPHGLGKGAAHTALSQLTLQVHLGFLLLPKAFWGLWKL